MKLKKLSCPLRYENFEDAYIIFYEADDEGNSNLELVAVPGNNTLASEGQNTGEKIAISIDKYPLTNILMSTVNEEKNELLIRAMDISDSPFHYYKMAFDKYSQAVDVYNKYAERILKGRAYDL